MWCWVWSCCALRWMAAPPPPTLWWEERKREREREGRGGRERDGEQQLHYLTTCSLEVLQMSFLFRTGLQFRFTVQKLHLCCNRLDTQCILRVHSWLLIPRNELEKLGPKGCANECISRQGSVIEDWKWHTVGFPCGMRLFVFQLC